jgi:glycerophosphoryl diester phosphodiesterase
MAAAGNRLPQEVEGAASSGDQSPFILDRRETPPLRLYAHRGASLLCPENTIEAFQRALQDGANALELDVHATADGHFVVAHDPDGRRLAGDPRPIRSLTLADIRRWRLGPEACAVPTLMEVLETFPNVPMSIDLKPNNRALISKLVATLIDNGAEAQVTIASFHNRIMTAIHASSWSGSTALSRLEVALVRTIPEAAVRRFVRGSAAQIPRVAGPLRLDNRRFLDRCRRLGLRADFWVVNDPDEARELLARGATGLMTDDPARIAPVVRQFERKTQEAES